jgi:transcriptional regulator with GAF, ATPase, and Fis domain
VAQARFREDLFYRLNVVPLFIAPLRERRGHILPLAARHGREVQPGTEEKTFSGSPPEAAELIQHSWPGNIRELKNVVERTTILALKAISTPFLSLRKFASPGTRIPGNCAE